MPGIWIASDPTSTPPAFALIGGLSIVIGMVSVGVVAIKLKFVSARPRS